LFPKNASKENKDEQAINGGPANRRTITPPAKTPVVQMLTISNVVCGFYAPLRAENMVQTPKPDARDDDHRKAQK
jgi:hypothetical protein